MNLETVHSVGVMCRVVRVAAEPAGNDRCAKVRPCVAPTGGVCPSGVVPSSTRCRPCEGKITLRAGNRWERACVGCKLRSRADSDTCAGVPKAPEPERLAREESV